MNDKRIGHLKPIVIIRRRIQRILEYDANKNTLQL